MALWTSTPDEESPEAEAFLSIQYYGGVRGRLDVSWAVRARNEQEVPSVGTSLEMPVKLGLEQSIPDTICRHRVAALPVDRGSTYGRVMVSASSQTRRQKHRSNEQIWPAGCN